MDKQSVHILSTATLPAGCVSLAIQHNIQVDILPFIRTKSVIDSSLKRWIKSVAQHPQTVIFTSKQAVQAVADTVKGQLPDWQFYCIEGVTRKEVLRNWNKKTILHTAPNGAALAKKIKATHSMGELLFFFVDNGG